MRSSTGRERRARERSLDILYQSSARLQTTFYF
jgi:hypothetical protein